jgi:competence protein ComEA
MTSRSLTNSAPLYRRILVFLLCLPLVFAATSCAKRSRATANSPPTSPANDTLASPATQRLNLNTAPAKELEVLPGIGKGLAERIVEHREKYGPFRRAEHLMMVRGISETRFRALRHLVAVE